MDDREILQAILEKVTGLETDMSGMKAEITDMKTDMSSVKTEITKINIKLENDVDKKIDLLLEGQQGMNEKFQKLDQVAENVEEIKAKVTALEAVTRDNTSQIKELRIAK